MERPIPRQTIVVPRGNRFATMIAVARNDFGGPLVLADDNELPAGISYDARPMPANLNLMPIVFSAAENAAIKNKTAPARWTYANIKHMRGQLKLLEQAVGEPLFNRVGTSTVTRT